MRISTLILSCLSSVALGAPSTDFGDHFYVPLESEAAIALVEKSSGQIRILRANPDGSVTKQPAFHSELPNVSGVTSGYPTGTGEGLILASDQSNRISVANAKSSSASALFPDRVGAKIPAYLRRSGTSPHDLALAHGLNSTGDFLSLYRDLPGTFDLLDEAGSFNEIVSFQPFYDTPAIERFAAGVINNGANTRLFYIGVGAGNNISGNFADNVPLDTKLASNVRRIDSLLMLVGYVEGSNDISLIPVSAPPALDLPITVTLPTPIGSISPAPAGVGPNHGILVISADGSTLSHYSIDALNNANLIEEVIAAGGDPITGIAAIDNNGFIVFTGDSPGVPGDFSYYQWNGGSWDRRDSGELQPLMASMPDFATLFWFSGEPLVDPTAQLLKLEVFPDWTSKSSPLPIPPSVQTESYVNTATGLGNPSTFAPSAPTGANHLVTNQYLETVSLSALDSVLALQIPPLSVTPASGTYSESVSVSGIVDDDLYSIFYRQSGFGTTWQPLTETFLVSYPSTWEFYSEDKMSGAKSPIISRSYDFSASDLLGFDTDNDGVPDFVEQQRGLSSSSGADADADGFTDLDEILNGSNPNDASSTPATSTSPFYGEGFRLLARPFNQTSSGASNGDPSDPTDLKDGEPVDVHGMTSNLLASAPVEALASPASLAGQLAANLNIGYSIPTREWLILNSPQYFNLDGAAPEVRGGREIYSIIQRPEQTPPNIAPAITGTNLGADTAAWIAAANAAYGTYEQVSAITAMNPVDTALAVLCEATIFDALNNLDPSLQTALGVPEDIPADPGPPATPLIPDYNQFTLFGNRDGDAERKALTPAMRDALLKDGLSFENLLSLLETSFASATNLQALTNALYTYHVAHSEPTAALPSDVIPLLPLPLDVLRDLTRGGSLPTSYSGAVSGAVVTAAQTEITTALALLNSAYRPTDTWDVEVVASIVPGETYTYINTSSINPVVFYEPDGDRMVLDQGLGLAIGTRFSVTGYTDVTGPAGYDAMEPISLNVAFVPEASDNDSNGNLLDDEWENFFFGEVGVKDPYDTHPINGYTYLQLFLIGHDPRDGNDEIPTEAQVDLSPDNVNILPLLSGNFGIQFDFPDDYMQHFNFEVQQTTTLTGFAPLPEATMDEVTPGTYEFDLGASAATPTKNFFRIMMSLSE